MRVVFGWRSVFLDQSNLIYSRVTRWSSGWCCYQQTVRISPISYFVFASVRAGDTMNGCDSLLLNTAVVCGVEKPYDGS